MPLQLIQWSSGSPFWIFWGMVREPATSCKACKCTKSTTPSFGFLSEGSPPEPSPALSSAMFSISTATKGSISRMDWSWCVRNCGIPQKWPFESKNLGSASSSSHPAFQPALTGTSVQTCILDPRKGFAFGLCLARARRLTIATCTKPKTQVPPRCPRV